MSFARVAVLILLGACITPAVPRDDTPRDEAPGDAAVRDDDVAPDGGRVVNPNPFLCGGAYQDPCADGKYCAYEDGCGTAANCFSKQCEPEGDPICGCDGKTYETECAAQLLGVSLSHHGPCADASAQFRCGEFTCDTGFYCVDKGPLADPGEQKFVCLALPDGCTGCNCKKDLAPSCWGGSTCIKDENHLTVRCK